MAEIEREMPAIPFGSAVTSAEAAAIDAGLRAHMLRIYNYMALGLVITAGAVFAIDLTLATGDGAHAARLISGAVQTAAHPDDALYLTSIGYALYVSPVKWAIIFAPLVLAFALSFDGGRLHPAIGQMLFWLYSGLMGLSVGALFILYAQTSVVRAFAISAASFTTLSLWGYTTGRELTGLGSFTVMGVGGLIAACLVNLTLASSALQWVTSIAGVALFAGLTGHDAQRLKNEYIYGAMDGDITERTAVLGALSLYLDFANPFTLLMQTTRKRED
jgi:uncharacterized protein